MKIIKIILSISVLASVLLLIIPTPIYLIDVVQSFVLQITVGYAFIAFTLIMWQKRRMALPFIAASALLLTYLFPYFSGRNTQDYEIREKLFRVAHFNVLGSNTKYDKIARQAQETQADLLSFQEVDSIWMEQLEMRLKEKYPYYHLACSSAYGVAIFSKNPVKDFTTYYWGGEPNLTGTVVLSDTSLHFVATHTLSPRSEERYARRNQHLHQMTRYLEGLEGPVLAIGDFNAVPWNPHMVRIRKKSDLLDSRQGFTPTYPARWEQGGIPIDYILHSKELSCLGFRAIDTAGSDHKGVMGEYQFANKEI